MPFEVYLPDDEPNTYPIPPRFYQDAYHAHDDCMPNTHLDAIVRQHSQPRVVYAPSLGEMIADWLGGLLRGLARRIGDLAKY